MSSNKQEEVIDSAGESQDNENIDSTNIFDEFSQDENLKSEVKDAQMRKERGSYYYLGIFNGFLKFINTTLVLGFITLFGYIYIQNNEDMYEIPSLDGVCFLFNDKSMYEETHCSSVASLLKRYGEKSSKTSGDFYTKVLDSIEDVYFVSNFAFSKDILFLLDRTKNRTSPLEMLEEFDRLKNEFEPINKGKLTCSQISISSEGILQMSCEAYSSRWDRKIIGPSGKTDALDNVGGTSISIASSFINYLEKEAKQFVLIEKQRDFAFDDVVDYGGYSRKTPFELSLKLKTNTILLK